jgi:hypothetical protein
LSQAALEHLKARLVVGVELLEIFNLFLVFLAEAYDLVEKDS